MEFSESYYIRQEKLQQLDIPTITEIKTSLGTELSKVLFESCPDSLQTELAISPKLEGPGEDLWISPSDLLISKVVLKPPLTNKHMKALSHEGILEIGRSIELKLLQAMELEKEKALADQERVMLFMAEKEKNKAISEALINQQALFTDRMEELEEDFQRLLQEELEKLEEHLREAYEKVLEEKTLALLAEQEQYWIERVENAVNEAADVITQQFLADMMLQEQQLTEIFTMKLEGQAERFGSQMKTAEEAFNATLKQLKHNLQCNNIANLMYVLCLERRKSLFEHTDIISMYNQKLKEAQNKADIQDEEIEKLRAERDYKERQCNVREECLLSVICQFQKFINFALKASPTQAEFLLSVKSMMLFELTQAVAHTASKDKQRRMRGLMPWRAQSKIFSEQNSEDNLLKDFHDCLNELPMPVQETDSGSLKAFTYNKHFYVREDFRNKISQGFPVRASSQIWNKDVEHLVHILANAVSETEHRASDVLEKDHRSYDSIKSSSVHFGGRDSLDQTIGLLAVQDSVILQKSQKSHLSTIDELVETSEPYDNLGVAILATNDSLTLTKNVGHYNSTEDEPVFQDCSKIIQLSHKEIDDGSSEQPKIEEVEPRDNIYAEPLRFQLSKNKIKSSDSADAVKSKKANESKKSSIVVASKTSRPPSISLERKGPDLPGSTSNLKKKPMRSKISMHRDSLELIRASNTGYNVSQKVLKDLITLKEETDKDISQFISLPSGKMGDVNFSHVAKIYSKTLYGKKSNASAQFNQDNIASVSKDDFLTKPTAVKVMGNSGNEYLESSKNFVVHRVHSILDILKKDDSLLRIFTRCHQ